MARQGAVKQELASLSYKSVIFSGQGAQKIGLMIAGKVGRYAVEKYGYPLIREVPFDFRDIAWDMADYTMTGLGALQAVAGFGLIKDIKAMRDKKNDLSAQYEKCTKMLELLEKAQ